MSNTWVVVLLSLGAALAFATSSSLKHVSAGRVPDAQSMEPTKLARFIRATVTHRLWLTGIGCDVVGVLLQTLALHFGALTLVQFLLLANLLFALVLRARLGDHPMTRRQSAWAVVLTVSLAGFLLIASPTAGSLDAADPASVTIAGVALGALAMTCILLGRRERNPSRAATLLGIAVGCFYASTAALLKTVTNIGADDPLQLLVSWQLYALAILGAMGMVLAQLTFQAGPLTASLPATSATDPLSSLAIGAFVYEEKLRTGPAESVLLIALLMLLIVAVVALSRAPETEPDVTEEVVPR